jgi:hypothetical protein
MKTILTLLIATLCAATGYGQTIKSLGYNSTNGQIVAATNVVWTNAFNFSTNTVAEQVRTNLGLGAAWLTNTNVTNFRNAIGLGAANQPTFAGMEVSDGTNTVFAAVSSANAFELYTPLWFGERNTNEPIFQFEGDSDAAIARSNLGLGLPALTNTSNVTTMRALSGSTNTNHPFSGSVSVVGTNNTNTLVFSNGILQEVQ